MKTKVLILLVSLFASMNLLGQYSIDTPYNYPVKPGTREWANFKTGEERLNACQIPIEVLSKLTTGALVETCMNYPLALEYLLSNDERMAISFMIENFNGLKELSRRTDGTIALLDVYKKISNINDQSGKSQAIVADPLSCGFLELLLVNDVFLEKLRDEDLKYAKLIALNVYEEKLSNPEIYGLLSVRRSFLVNSVIIMKRKYDLTNTESAAIEEFVGNYSSIVPEKLEYVSRLITEK